MKKTIIIVFVLFIGILVTYSFFSNTKDVHTVNIESLKNNTINPSTFSGTDKDYLKIIDKVKKGENLTDEELEQIDKRRIQNLAKIDEKASKLELELQTKGYLAEDDYNYLSTKRQELEKLVILESIKKANSDAMQNGKTKKR